MPDTQPAQPLLVVDDDPLLRGMAARTLRHAGFEVSAVDSGEAALEAFAQAPCALVLLDVLMPGIDGYETCRRLRALEGGANVPVLMLTGLNDTEAIEQAYAAGATDFIAKPIHWTLLAQRVRYALRAAAAGAQARRNGEQLERAQRIARMGSWELSADGRRMVCSAALVELLGSAGPPTLLDRPEHFLALVHADDRPALQAARQHALHDGVPYQLNFRVQGFDGVERTVYEQARPLRDRAGRSRGVEGITQDISERVEAERRISHLAHFDSVTGLPNRQFFIELAAPALERAARLGSACALLHVDIDRFKSVNDALGRSAGDQVLAQLAERLQASVRAADMAAVAHPAEACVARVGANAFTLLLVEVGSERQAAAVAERLLAAVALPLQVAEGSLNLSASIGIAMFPRDAREPRAMARAAEQAVYEAKSAGRGQLRFFDAAIHAAASQRLTREGELRRAIAGGQLRLHYQAKVDAGSGRILGAEALVRWQHPDRGLVPPAEFIPLAEDSGLILPLTDWVLETVMGDLRRRVQAQAAVVPVSVNLASPCFLRDGLVQQLDALLARHGIAPELLTIEVTESLLMRDLDLAVRRLGELRERSLHVSLDDFGTGYSSLAYLQRFRIDELKIDRSFVAEAWRGGRHGAIARSVIALGREFGLQVVAEGVETVAQRDFLLQCGCARQQGFLFARPLEAGAFEALLDHDGGRLPAASVHAV